MRQCIQAMCRSSRPNFRFESNLGDVGAAVLDNLLLFWNVVFC
jgi:hypothetical protein